MSERKIKRSEQKMGITELERMAEILKAISHPYRLKIIEILLANEVVSVADILEQVGIEQSLLSYHLIKMKDKKILKSNRVGRSIYYRLAIKDISKIFDCMGQYDIL